MLKNSGGLELLSSVYTNKGNKAQINIFHRYKMAISALLSLTDIFNKYVHTKHTHKNGCRCLYMDSFRFVCLKNITAYINNYNWRIFAHVLRACTGTQLNYRVHAPII